MAKYDVSLNLPSLREWYQQVIKDPSLLRDYDRKLDWFLRNATWNDMTRKKRTPVAAKEDHRRGDSGVTVPRETP